jgi:hypothetical protein
MFPGLPTSLSGAYVIESTVDEECSANIVTRLGKPFGCWLDDGTENAEHGLDYYVGLAVAKYRPLNQTVFVCVPPGQPHLRHPPSPPVVNVYERYVFGMGVPPEAWGPCPKYAAYVIQRRWPGTHGKTAPTDAEFEQVLAEVQAHHPTFIFLF